MARGVKADVVGGIGVHYIVCGWVAFRPIGKMIDFKAWAGAGRAKALLGAIQAAAQGHGS